jgi:hypothetical protein
MMLALSGGGLSPLCHLKQKVKFWLEAFPHSLGMVFPQLASALQCPRIVQTDSWTYPRTAEQNLQVTQMTNLGN